MSDADKQRIKMGKSNIENLIDDLESGRIYPEDLGAEQISRLKSLLLRERNR